MSILGVDIGTTGVKAVTFNAEGKGLSSGYCEYAPVRQKPGWLTQS